MSYLEQRKWEGINPSNGKNGPRKIGLWKKTKVVGFVAILFVAFLTVVGTFLSGSKTYFNPYKGIIGVAYASPPGKALDFMITKARDAFAHFVNGKFPLGTEISIVPKGEGEKLGTELDSIRFAMLNIGDEYFNTTAADWISSSRLLGEGKKMTEVLATENLSMAFQPVAFRAFQSVSKDVRGSERNMTAPFLLNDGDMQGLNKGFQRRFADGVVRTIKPNDTWAFFRPNTHGLWRKSEADKTLGAPSLEPEESLPVALYVLTNLCDWKTGQWDVKATQWLVSRQYAISYGIWIDPDAIQILGEGLQARFIYEEKLPVDMVIVRWAKDQQDPNWEPNEKDEIIDVPVPVLNVRNELCFWGSKEPDQSIVIPWRYLHKTDKDDHILLGNRASAEEIVDVTFQDILDELQQVKDNQSGQQKFIHARRGEAHSAAGYNLSGYVVRTNRLAEIVGKIIGNNTKTKEEAVEKLMAFTNENLPYQSDHKGDKNAVGYNGPLEVLKSPLVALMDRGDDCEGIAFFLASLWYSAEHPLLNGFNKTCGLVLLDYSGIGHVVPLIPGIGEPVTDPFPNHILLENTVYSYMEPTGLGYNELHQTKPSKRGYLPEYAMFIEGVGSTRQVGVLGFNQFEYVQSVKR